MTQKSVAAQDYDRSKKLAGMCKIAPRKKGVAGEIGVDWSTSERQRRAVGLRGWPRNRSA